MVQDTPLINPFEVKKPLVNPFQKPLVDPVEEKDKKLASTFIGPLPPANFNKPLMEPGKPGPVGETVLALGTGLAASIPRGYGELLSFIPGAEQVSEALRKTPSYEPRTYGGRFLTQAITAAAAVPIEALGNLLGDIAKFQTQTELDLVTKAYHAIARTPSTASEEQLKRDIATDVGGLMSATTQAVTNLGLMRGAGKAGDMKLSGSLGKSANIFGDWFKSLMPKSDRIRVDEQIFEHQGALANGRHHAELIERQLEELVPDTARRAEVSFAVEGDTEVVLSPKERQAVNLAKSIFSKIEKVEKDEGILESSLDDYLTHIFNLRGRKSLALLDSIKSLLMPERAGAGGLATKTRFAKERLIRMPIKKILDDPRYKYLNPETDISKIVRARMEASVKALANKRLLDTLKAMKDPDGRSLLIHVKEGTKIPRAYKRSEHPQLFGYAIHPDIMPSLRMLYSSEPMMVTRALLSFNYLAKRFNVSLSGFHAKNLFEAYLVGGGNPLKLKGAYEKYWSEQYGGTYKEALDGGLKVGQSVEDITGEPFYAAMQDIANGLDKIHAPFLSVPVKAFIKSQSLLDRFMWDYMHTSMKLQLWSSSMERLLSKFPDAPRSELARAAAQFSNRAVGGLDWVGMAHRAKTDFGYRFMAELYSPRGRRAMQAMIFAPDWTISTTSAMLRALPGVANKYEAALHRAYVARSAVYYMTVLNALNIASVGHPIWENEDPTVIVLPNGQHMNAAKHTMEFIHLMRNPSKFLISKLSPGVSEAAEQAGKVEYLGPEFNKLPRMKSRAGHLASRFEPFVFEQDQSTGGYGSLGSAFGVPIFGQSIAAKERKKEAAKERRLLKKEGN